MEHNSRARPGRGGAGDPGTGAGRGGGAEIEPAALAAVKQMGEFLRSLQDVEFEARTTRDEVLESGQLIKRSQVLTAYVRPPTGLRIDAVSAEKERQYYYDGKTLTIFGPRTMYYASVDAPPTIREMVTAITEKYDIELPLTDLFLWGTEDEDQAAVVSAFRVGVDRFGIACATATPSTRRTSTGRCGSRGAPSRCPASSS